MDITKTSVDSMNLTHKLGLERGTLWHWMTAKVYLWDNSRHQPIYHLRMYRLPSNIRRKQVDSPNNREGRDLSKHIRHPCLITSHTHILRINTTALLTVLDTFHNLSSSTRPCFNLDHQDQHQLTAPLQSNPVGMLAFNRRPILTIKHFINKATMIIRPIRITRSTNTSIRIALD